MIKMINDRLFSGFVIHEYYDYIVVKYKICIDVNFVTILSKNSVS